MAHEASANCESVRALRRSVRPLVWLVLEELALTAVTVDGGQALSQGMFRHSPIPRRG